MHSYPCVAKKYDIQHPLPIALGNFCTNYIKVTTIAKLVLCSQNCYAFFPQHFGPCNTMHHNTCNKHGIIMQYENNTGDIPGILLTTVTTAQEPLLTLWKVKTGAGK